MKNPFFKFLFSTRLMSVVILSYAFAMAAATFIENDYGTPTTKSLIYNTKWFELLMLILVVNFIGNIFKYRLYRREKWPIFLFHIAFIVTLFGSFVTRYYSYEGVMLIREGKVSSTILSDKTYIKVRVDDNKVMTKYNEPVLFGRLGFNKFRLKSKFGKIENRFKAIFGLDDNRIPFSIELVDFVANAKERLVADKTGVNYLHLVETSSGSRNDIFIKKGEVKSINGVLFTYNNPVAGGMNFTDTSGKPMLQPVFDGNFMEMQTQKLTTVAKDSFAPLQLKKLYTFNNMRFVVKALTKGKIKREAASKKEKNFHPYDAVTLKVTSGDEEKIITVKGTKGVILKPKELNLNGLNFYISYGSKQIETPFSVKLRDFELERYPGTKSPSSYASEVTVIDKDQTFDYRIYMNHVLDYKGFRFFQSSYDPDELGTHLSVNHDYWGTLITYLGYILMGIGMFFTLFWKGSRFKDLAEKLKKISKNKATVLVFLSFGILGFAQESHTHSTEISTKTPEELQKLSVSKKHADKLGRLLIQDYQGRIKPINTYALEAIRKIYGKDYYKGLSAEQVLISAQLNPNLWSFEPIIKTYEERLGKKIVGDLHIKDGHTAISEFFKDRKYYLQKRVDESFQKNSALRTYTDKEIINLDEKVNIWSGVLSGSLMKIYPKKGATNNKWYVGTDAKTFVAQDTMILKFHQLYMYSLYNAIKTNDYKDADFYLEQIKNYQKNIGASIIPTQNKIDLEIKYNKWNIFFKLLIYYFSIGAILLFLAFVDLFKPNFKIVKKSLQFFIILTIFGMVAHATGLGVRWYISGHAPWSNGYEATVFIAFITTLAGLIFSYKRSKFIIAVAVFFAGFLLGIAHGSLMSPEMTNLVPVLKSYWLMIHVAVITASYAFLGLGSLLGFIVLLLFIIRTPANKNRLNETIKELTYVNESTLIVGLFMLSIGTFLGGVWANESWGRYWSWDPKEVWALISMMIYIFILHMRMVPGLQSRFAFNFTSMVSIATLIMTYFGVNYYLSGMHSYATGDPVPFPVWAYYAIAFIIIFSIVSYNRYKKFKRK